MKLKIIYLLAFSLSLFTTGRAESTPNVTVENSCDTPTLASCQYNAATGEATLNWSEVPGATGYEITISVDDPECGCQLVGGFQFTDIVSSNSYVIPGAFFAKCLSYTVRTICYQGLLSDPVTGCYDAGANCDPPCETAAAFYLPTEACFGDPIHFVNQSTAYDRYRIYVCIAGPNNQCNGNSVNSGWQNGPQGSLELGQAYNDWSGASDWLMWCGNTYRVTLAVQSDCENWVTETKFITITCPPCPDNRGGRLAPEQSGLTENLVINQADVEQSRLSVQTVQVEVVPNPFQAETQLRFELSEAATLSLELYGLDGKLLRRETSQRAAGAQTWTIPGDWLPTEGLYHFVLRVDEAIINGKLLKTN